MEEPYIISRYCIIRSNRLILNGDLLFEGNDASPSAFFTSLYRHFNINYPKFFKMDTLCKLGFLASEFILRNNGLPGSVLPDQVGLVLANAGSSIDSDRNHQRSISDRNGYFPSPSVFVYTLANIVIGEICIRHKLLGESIFFIDKEFNSGRMYNYIKYLLENDIVSSCIAGWLEMDGDHYDAALYLVQKSASDNDGIVIFEPGKLLDIYLQRT